MNKKNILLILLVFFIGVSLIYIKHGNEDNQATREREVKLYFSTKDAMYLQAETRKTERDDIYQFAVEELIKGPESSALNRTIPDEVKVLDIDIDNNTAHLNFNKSLVDNHWGGSTGETMTVYSIVNTMTQFSGLESVMILIEGEEIETLAGHMDLSKPLKRNEKIIKE